ncbi:MAG: hypothetical protein H7Y86_16295 [Rhizobacter sp.]|nr:hypothetical protein [Ferruginibacter sp.]
MKKLLLLLSIASFGIGGTAMGQKKSKKNCDNNNKNYSKKYDRNNDDQYNRNGSYNNKYTSNAPRKVRDAFERDYPNASNVSWTKERGVWTVSFKRSGLFGGSNSVSYQANGQRVNTNNNGIFGSRDNDRTAKANTQKRSGVFGKTRNQQ